MKYTAFPTWFVAKVFFSWPFRRFIRPDHPWLKWQTWPPLENWAAHRTSVCKQIDLVFWVQWICLLILAYRFSPFHNS